MQLFYNQQRGHSDELHKDEHRGVRHLFQRIPHLIAQAGAQTSTVTNRLSALVPADGVELKDFTKLKVGEKNNCLTNAQAAYPEAEKLTAQG